MSNSNILLLEDDPALLELTTLSLELEGFNVTGVNNGKEAIAILANQSFDMIATDMVMPVMDGMKFLCWLRQEKQDSTPVLVLTSMASETNRQKLLAAGATLVAFKPIDIDEFIAKVKELA